MPKPFGTRGGVIIILFRDMDGGKSRFWNAHCAGSVVLLPVVRAWYEGPLCGLPVVQRVVRSLVVLHARRAERDRVLGVVPIEARYAACGTMRVWSAHAGGNPSDGDRVAEHAVPADRCAREIVAFLRLSYGALAAAERQSVGRLTQSLP